jgi:U3 small nucleolar RNA-associated protein 11
MPGESKAVRLPSTSFLQKTLQKVSLLFVFAVLGAEPVSQVQQHLERSTLVDKGAYNVVLTGSSGGSELGWKIHESVKSKRRRKKSSTDGVDDDPEEEKPLVNIVRDCISVFLSRHPSTCIAQKHRKHLLQELAARLVRDTQLSYALRELEMQRLLVGKGGRKKVRGAELVEEDGGDSPEDEDSSPPKQKSDPSVYKPRVYKWRVERKR